jgi:hypothetical protein
VDISDDYTGWLYFSLGGFSYQTVTIQQKARAGEAARSARLGSGRAERQ